MISEQEAADFLRIAEAMPSMWDMENWTAENMQKSWAHVSYLVRMLNEPGCRTEAITDMIARIAGLIATWQAIKGGRIVFADPEAK